MFPAKQIILLFAVLIFISCNQQKQEKDTVAGNQIIHTDPLPSWNEGAVKKSITDFVTETTNEGSADFIPVADRIACFDNDGTLWSEQPMYFQLFFAMDRVRSLAPEHPEWKNKQPFKAVLDNDMEELGKQGVNGLLEIVVTTHAGTTVEEFDRIAKSWIASATHPVKKKLYKELVFQPMLELIKYLQANEFNVFIVSGGGIDFMRPWVEEVYGVPRDQVVGSSAKIRYDYNNGSPVVRKLSAIEYVDDKEGKPEGIQRFIGRKPVFVAGNSDGDLEMMHWADSNPLKNFQVYVHHTDSVREWAYDRHTHFGKFDKGLDEAIEKGWIVIDMAKDWKVVYPSEK